MRGLHGLAPEGGLLPNLVQTLEGTPASSTPVRLAILRMVIVRSSLTPWLCAAPIMWSQKPGLE